MTAIDANTVVDLRRAYLSIHGSAIVATLPEVASDLSIPRRYANELLAVLQDVRVPSLDVDVPTLVPLVVVNEEPPHSSDPDDPHTWFQTYYTVDDFDSDQAADYFDRVIIAIGKPQPSIQPTQPTQRKATAMSTKNSNPADLPLCLCGCSAPVNSRKRNYRPGHDARHAGQVARIIANPDTPKGEANAAHQSLPTDALRYKAAAMADRLVAKSIKGRLSTTPVHGSVRVGRWDRMASKSADGTVRYQPKKGSADWVEADAKVAATFKPNSTEA